MLIYPDYQNIQYFSAHLVSGSGIQWFIEKLIISSTYGWMDGWIFYFVRKIIVWYIEVYNYIRPLLLKFKPTFRLNILINFLVSCHSLSYPCSVVFHLTTGTPMVIKHDKGASKGPMINLINIL